MLTPTYSYKQAAPYPPWVQEFSALTRALGGRDNAVAYVELGGRTASQLGAMSYRVTAETRGT